MEAVTLSPLVRRYLKTAFLFAILGLLTGGWLMAGRDIWGRPPSSHLITAHVHVLLVGFVIMTIMGVGTWMFPRPSPRDVRYKIGFVETTYWLITVGTTLRFSGEIVLA